MLKKKKKLRYIPRDINNNYKYKEKLILLILKYLT